MRIYRIASSPIKVYHGSNSPSIQFDPSQQKSGYYPGFYTIISPDTASTFGSHLHAFYLNPDKYYNVPDDRAANNLKRLVREKGYPVTQGSGTPEVNCLKDLGYHGIKRGDEYIVFDPQQNLKPAPDKEEIYFTKDNTSDGSSNVRALSKYDQKEVGYVHYSKDPHTKAFNIYYIKVNPAFTRQGIGTQLIEEMMKQERISYQQINWTIVTHYGEQLKNSLDQKYGPAPFKTYRSNN